MKYLILTLILSILSSCVNNSNDDSENNQSINIQSSEINLSSSNISKESNSSSINNGNQSSSISLNEVVEPTWIHEKNYVKNFTVIEHNEASGLIKKQQTDSVCQRTFDDGESEYTWSLPPIDTLWYKIENDTLKRSFEGVSYSMKYFGSNELFGRWQLVYPSGSEITLNINQSTIKEKTKSEYDCTSNEYVFEGSSAEYVSCDKFKIDLNGQSYIISGGQTILGSAWFRELENFKCLIQFHSLQSEKYCKKIEPETSKDCAAIFSRIAEISPDKTKLCSIHNLDDGICSTDCMNLSLDPDC